MKKFSFILLFVFLLQLVTIVEAKEIDTNNPIEVACDFACYYDPEYAVGFNIDNSTVVMEDSKYVAVSISNVKPIGAGLIVVLEKVATMSFVLFIAKTIGMIWFMKNSRG